MLIVILQLIQVFSSLLMERRVILAAHRLRYTVHTHFIALLTSLYFVLTVNFPLAVMHYWLSSIHLNGRLVEQLYYIIYTVCVCVHIAQTNVCCLVCILTKLKSIVEILYISQLVFHCKSKQGLLLHCNGVVN